MASIEEVSLLVEGEPLKPLPKIGERGELKALIHSV